MHTYPFKHCCSALKCTEIINYGAVIKHFFSSGHVVKEETFSGAKK